VVNARLGHSWHPLANATLVGVLCADRRHQGCQCGDRRLRYVADFRAALGQAAACQCL